MTATATITCVGRKRDGRPCTAPASATVETTDGPLDVCGVHRIAFEETAFGHGRDAAAVRVLTGARP